VQRLRGKVQTKIRIPAEQSADIVSRLQGTDNSDFIANSLYVSLVAHLLGPTAASFLHV